MISFLTTTVKFVSKCQHLKKKIKQSLYSRNSSKLSVLFISRPIHSSGCVDSGCWVEKCAVAKRTVNRNIKGYQSRHIKLYTLDMSKIKFTKQEFTHTPIPKRLTGMNIVTQTWVLYPLQVEPVVSRQFILCQDGDYISIFMGFGKAAFLNSFYQDVSVIGSLHDVSSEQGLFSFYSLIGSVYYKTQTKFHSFQLTWMNLQAYLIYLNA